MDVNYYNLLQKYVKQHNSIPLFILIVYLPSATDNNDAKKSQTIYVLRPYNEYSGVCYRRSRKRLSKQNLARINLIIDVPQVESRPYIYIKKDTNEYEIANVLLSMGASK